MTRVVGIDPGTVSLDLCGLADGVVWLDQSLPTQQTLADPSALLALLTAHGPPDLIAGPSGYGLPLVRGDQATESDLRLAYLAGDGETGGLGGLRRLARLCASAGLPLVYTPGVIHLSTVPAHRKLNRVDIGTADKVASAALAIHDQAERLGGSAAHTSFILLELGGAFTAALAVDSGAIVDGVGGSSGPIGWRAAGAWDGEVAYLSGKVSKEMLFRGGLEDAGDVGLQAYIEGAHKAVLALTAALPQPREILLSGRHAADAAVRETLDARLSEIAPVRLLTGFATVAKQGAQGAALIADGLLGGRSAPIVESLRLRESSGTALDYLRVISPDEARTRIGID